MKVLYIALSSLVILVANAIHVSEARYNAVFRRKFELFHAGRNAAGTNTRFTLDKNPQGRTKRLEYIRRQKRQDFDPHEIDLVFLVDKSSRIDPFLFAKEQIFLENLLGHLPVFPARTRVACVSVSAQSNVEFDFNKHINKECTIEGIRNNIRYTGGQSPLLRAINLINEKFIFDTDAGARRNAQKILVVFTDSHVDNSLKRASARLRQSGVMVIAIGLTRRITPAMLTSLASNPEYAFYMENSNTWLLGLVKLLGGDELRDCRDGQVMNDQCGRKCRCSGGKLVECRRVRKQFTEMSLQERARYIEVVKAASTKPAYKDKYEEMLTVHKTLFNTGIHRAKFFLPWHRWFLLEYENFLRQIDCSITVPYWESMEEANDALSSDLWNSRPHGFGGNGTGESNCVTDGPFREGEWSMIASAGGGCLTRNFRGRFPDCLAVREAFLEFANVTEFENFQEFLHREYHDAVHCAVGGSMCSDNSASSPEFFLHHAFVDKLWNDWQRQSKQHTWNKHFMQQKTKMPSNVYFSGDLLDLRYQPGCVCAEYRDPSDTIYKTVAALSKLQVKRIARVELPPYPEEAKRLFQLLDVDMEKLRKIRRLLQPEVVLRGNQLDGRDRILGFRRSDLMGNQKTKTVFRRSVENNMEFNNEEDGNDRNPTNNFGYHNRDKDIVDDYIGPGYHIDDDRNDNDNKNGGVNSETDSHSQGKGNDYIGPDYQVAHYEDNHISNGGANYDGGSDDERDYDSHYKGNGLRENDARNKRSVDETNNGRLGNGWYRYSHGDLRDNVSQHNAPDSYYIHP